MPAKSGITDQNLHEMLNAALMLNGWQGSLLRSAVEQVEGKGRIRKRTRKRKSTRKGSTHKSPPK
jgi:hypothetical protein